PRLPTAWTSPVHRRAGRRSRSRVHPPRRLDPARKSGYGRGRTAFSAAHRLTPRTGTASAVRQANTFRPCSLLRLGQIPVHQHHCHRPFADGCGHPFGGFGAHITCNKHTGHTCFQVVRRTVQGPAGDVLEVRAGQDETVVVLGHDI